MKRILLSVLAATLFFVFPLHLVFAQSPSPTNDKRDRLEVRREKLQERRDERKEKLATRAVERREKHIERIREKFAGILSRVNKHLERTDKIVEKIKTRIEKLKLRGVDTAKAEADLVSCATQKEAAQAAIADAKAKVELLDPAASTRDTVVVSVSAMHAGRDALHAYKKCLVDVVSQLKASAALREGTTSAQ